MTISEIIQKYKDDLDYLDIELILAHSLGKTREFVLTYPEQTITKIQETKIKKNIERRLASEPIAYIIGHKEFYGLDFIVNKHTLVPRPETELMVEEALNEISNFLRRLADPISNLGIIDVGTGSGNIIASVAHKLENKKNSRVIPDLIRNPESGLALDYRLRGNDNIKYYATDISEEALKVAKKNAKLNGVDKKIKFLHGSLLLPIIGNWISQPAEEIGNSTMIIVANLPYLSKEIYDSAPTDVKKFEPKTALYSAEDGLAHYHKLLLQIKKLLVVSCKLSVISYFEISPEQKQPITKLIKSIFPTAKVELSKDLAGKWRVCKVIINISPSP